jgi:hypothetical protein
MTSHLLFLFLFQGGIAFAFTYFIARVLLDGLAGEARDRMLKGMGKVRLLMIACALFFPAAMFGAYYKSLPEGESTGLALLPALWILVIMLALVAGLTLAMLRPQKTEPRHD